MHARTKIGDPRNFMTLHLTEYEEMETYWQQFVQLIQVSAAYTSVTYGKNGMGVALTPSRIQPKSLEQQQQQ